MKKTARTVGGIAICASISMVLSGCGGPSAGGAPTALTSIPDTDPTATIQVVSHMTLDNDGMQKVIDAFEKEHPTIKVEWKAVPFKDMNSLIDSRISQKSGAMDVYYVDQPRLAALVSRGYLEELTAAFSDQTSEWDKSATEAHTYDGKLWAVPLATSTQLLYYNKDILDKAGLMAPSADPDKRISWEALKSEAAKAQSNGGAKYGFMFGQMDRYYQLEPLFVEAGGGTGISGDDGLTPDFESNGWTKALEYYKSLFADGVSPRGQEEMQDEFYAGNVAFMQDGTWAIDKASKTDFNWGVAASPTFEGTDAKTPTGSWSLGMNPYSDSKEAAAIFMNWMACQDGGQISVYQPAPDLPASKKARERYFTRDVFQTDAGKNAVNLINYELENTAVIRPQTIGYVEFEEVLNRAFADVRNGADPTTSLKNATTQLNTAWAAYK